MKTLNINSINATTFPQSINSLLHHCEDVTNLSTKLLAGKWRPRSRKEESDCDASPSFADMDIALDEALKACLRKRLRLYALAGGGYNHHGLTMLFCTPGSALHE